MRTALRQSAQRLASATNKKDIYVTTTQKKDGDIVTERFVIDPKGIDWRYRELFSEKYDFKPEYTSQDWINYRSQMFHPKKPAGSPTERFLWQMIRKFEKMSTAGDEEMQTPHLAPGARHHQMRMQELRRVSSTSYRASEAFKIRFWNRDETRITMERKRRLRVVRPHHSRPYYRAWSEQRVPLLKEFVESTRNELVAADPHDRTFLEKLRQLQRAKRRLKMAEEALADPDRAWYPMTLIPGKEDNPQVYCSWTVGTGHPLDRYWWHHRWGPSLLYTTTHTPQHATLAHDLYPPAPSLLSPPIPSPPSIPFAPHPLPLHPRRLWRDLLRLPGPRFPRRRPPAEVRLSICFAQLGCVHTPLWRPAGCICQLILILAR